MTVNLIIDGQSRSFPGEVPAMQGRGTILAGTVTAEAIHAAAASNGEFVAVELGNECLAEHIGLEKDAALARIVGFARFRLGTAEPSNLIELVATDWTDTSAVEAAKAAFTAGGFAVASCADRPGRIVNRLIRPYLNAVLRRLDDGLASAADMDQTLMLGLGYPEGPNAMLERTGLADHFDVSAALAEMLGDADFAPARRARIAWRRAGE
jgi:3-hydroxybutyryl-CoA dehydrogenase